MELLVADDLSDVESFDDATDDVEISNRGCRGEWIDEFDVWESR